MQATVGIDPGKAGAATLLDFGVIEVIRCPFVKRMKGVEEFDLEKMCLIAKNWATFKPIVFIEEVHSFPGQGVTSMFSMGYGFAAWRTAFTAAGLAPRLVPPREWRNYMGLSVKLEKAGKCATKAEKDLAYKQRKELSIKAAQEIYPDVRGDGEADSLLIAKYGQRRLEDDSFFGRPENEGTARAGQEQA